MNKKVFFLKKLYKRIIDDDITALAAQLTYYLILSIFPFLIFLITLVSYTPITSEQAINEMSLFLPPYAYNIVIDIINQVISVRSVKLLSFGMLVAIWIASDGIYALIKGINKAYDQNEERPYWKTKIISIIILFALILVFICTFSMLVFGKIIGINIFEFLGFSSIFKTIWNVSRFIIPFITMIILFIILYYYTPNKRVISFKKIIPGAIFSTFGWIIISIIFSFYINNFNTYASMYGSIGSIIGLLIWIYWSSMLILVGAEINGTIYFNDKLILSNYNNKIEREVNNNIECEVNNNIECEVIKKLIDKNIKISVAESCTGGLLSKRFTDVSGISKIFDRAIVSYSNQSKIESLNIKKETIKNFGEVSKETAIEMANGIRRISKTDIGISVTGIAGPLGGTKKKPVGLVFIALSHRSGVMLKELNLKGDRTNIRNTTLIYIFDMIKEYLEYLENIEQKKVSKK